MFHFQLNPPLFAQTAAGSGTLGACRGTLGALGDRRALGRPDAREIRIAWTATTGS